MTVEVVEHARPRRDATGAANLRRGLRRLGLRLAREPLVHFFAAGLVLFAASEHHKARTDLYRIVVTGERVRQLGEAYRAEFGAAPSAHTLDRLVDHYVEEEALYREGLARKLDRDDEIVRRRIVQKMQFLAQDLAAPAEPGEPELRAWYAVHRASYVVPASVGFSHVFFADGADGSQGARRRAEAALAGLSDAVVRAPERGDPFPDLFDYPALGPEQARRLFGDSELSRKLFEIAPGRWVGPFRSDYGWHLVRVAASTPARAQSFAEARERVRADLIAARQDAADRASLAALKSRFTVVREDRR